MPKKEIKTKNKCNTTSSLGRMQKNNKREVWECVLYLRGKRADLLELAHRASYSESISWSISKIRPENTTTTMLQLQYKFRGCRCNIFKEYDELRGGGVCQCNLFGQTENSKSVRLVRFIIREV